MKAVCQGSFCFLTARGGRENIAGIMRTDALKSLSPITKRLALVTLASDSQRLFDTTLWGHVLGFQSIWLSSTSGSSRRTSSAEWIWLQPSCQRAWWWRMDGWEHPVAAV